MNLVMIIVIVLTAANCGRQKNRSIRHQTFAMAKNFNALEDLSDSIAMLQDRTSGKCFRLKNAEAVNGNTLEPSVCSQTDTAQQFHLTERTDGSYKFASMVDKQFCVDNKNQFREGVDLIVWRCHPDNQSSVGGQKVFVNKTSGKAEMTISFEKDKTAYARIDGNKIKQTLNENDATVWKVSLQDATLAAPKDSEASPIPEPTPTPEEKTPAASRISSVTRSICGCSG